MEICSVSFATAAFNPATLSHRSLTVIPTKNRPTPELSTVEPSAFRWSKSGCSAFLVRAATPSGIGFLYDGRCRKSDRIDIDRADRCADTRRWKLRRQSGTGYFHSADRSAGVVCKYDCRDRFGVGSNSGHIFPRNSGLVRRTCLCLFCLERRNDGTHRF